KPSSHIEHVYAYLPLRKYGFRFIIQANWTVTSSREAVDSGLTWNHWLRDKIPDLFASAAKDLGKLAEELLSNKEGDSDSESNESDESDSEYSENSQDEELEVEDNQDTKSAMHLLNTLYQVIPLPGQVDDFFSQVPISICRNLQKVPIVLSETNELVLPQ